MASTAFTVTQMDVVGTAANGFVGSISASSGGFAVGSVSVYNPFQQARWYTIPLNAVTVNAGDTCTVTLRPVIFQPGGRHTMTLLSNAIGGTPLSITTACIGAPCTFGPPCLQPPFVAHLVFRLRGPACTGGTPAATTPAARVGRTSIRSARCPWARSDTSHR